MVAIIHHSKCVRDVLSYNERKVEQGKAELIMANKFLCDIEHLTFKNKLNRFRLLNQANPRAKTNTLHISLNFHVNDRLDADMLHTIATSYMEKIGFGEQPFLVYEHKDAGHPHIHIVTSLVQQDGTRINTHNIGRLLSEPARKQLEKDFGLSVAGTPDNPKQSVDIGKPRPAAYGIEGTKDAIAKVVSFVCKEYKYCSIPELNAVLRAFNVHAETGLEGSYLKSTDGIQYRILDKNGLGLGVPIKGSSLPSKPIMRTLRKRFAVNEVLRKRHKGALAEEIKMVLNDSSISSWTAFSRALAARNIDVLTRTNEAGRTYGVTYVDHRNRCVFNGSHLGKDFSPVGLQRTFEANSQSAQPLNKAVKNENANLADGFELTSPMQLSLQILTEPGLQEDMPFELSPRKRKKKKRRHNNN